MGSIYSVLKTREIINILNGDRLFETSGKTYKMPYLSGPDICKISEMFGLFQTYNKGIYAGFSRWQYMDNLLDYCIEKDNILFLLKYLFSKKNFKTLFDNRFTENIDSEYEQHINIIINQINNILYFDDYKLIVIGNDYIITKINLNTPITIPSMKRIDRAYINDLAERALLDIETSQFDSALTKSRTMLEEVFCYLLEKSGEESIYKGDIKKCTIK